MFTWNILSFLEDLSVKLDPLYHHELNKLKSLKSNAKNEPIDHLNPWDVLYYQKKLLKTEYNVDDELVRQYFPLQTVVKGVLEVYQEILRYVRVRSTRSRANV